MRLVLLASVAETPEGVIARRVRPRVRAKVVQFLQSRLGHACNTMDELYDKIKEDGEFRKTVATDPMRM